ncbi:MAG: Asp23/Gls24 family envelope stress response protein [Oscillospiraceae bacterium]|nr:Asp23/Gls24 family envelope stress response protein [Oscillospiraceae bacterium]
MSKAVDPCVNSVKVSEGVIEKITELAISSVDGVCGIAKGRFRFDQLFTPKACQPSAVTVKVNDGAVEIFTEIDVLSSCKVKNVAEKIQQRVKDDVQNMTGIAVTKINVFVKNIVFDNE